VGSKHSRESGGKSPHIKQLENLNLIKRIKMGHGGQRPGAGRKKGALTRRVQEIIEKAAADGESPLEFLLKAMRDDTGDFATRLDAAKAAAPYMHPRLAAVEMEVSGDEENPLTVRNRIEFAIVDSVKG
jgi:hypothetical protein